MRGGQDTGILHVALEIPELGQSHSRDIHNIGRVRDGHFRIRSFEGGNQRQDKVEQVLIQSEKR